MAKTDTQISLRVTSQFKARLERQAERERRSVSNLILKVMEEYLGTGGGEGELRLLKFYSHYFHIAEQNSQGPARCMQVSGCFAFSPPSRLLPGVLRPAHHPVLL